MSPSKAAITTPPSRSSIRCRASNRSSIRSKRESMRLKPACISPRNSEVRFDTVKTLVDNFKTLIDNFKTLVDLVETLVDAVEPLFESLVGPALRHQVHDGTVTRCLHDVARTLSILCKDRRAQVCRGARSDS